MIYLEEFLFEQFPNRKKYNEITSGYLTRTRYK